MSELPKVVFSRTLREPLAWNNSRLAKGDLVYGVRALKPQTGEPLRSIGSLSVVKGLLVAGMVDRLWLTVFPQILGSTGREPVFTGLPAIDLELVDTNFLNVLDARLVMLEYRLALMTWTAETFICGYVCLLFRKSWTSSLKASLYSIMSQCLHCPKTCICTSFKRANKYKLVSRGIITSSRPWTNSTE